VNQEQLTPNDVAVNPVLAEVVRSGFVESRHRGAVAALATDGTFAFTAGSANAPVYPRSSNKPLPGCRSTANCSRWPPPATPARTSTRAAPATSSTLAG
jgi:L-asparaginase II